MNYSTPKPRHLLSTFGGSLVVCVITPAAVYLSADSRYAGASHGLRDSARKLLACGSTAVCGLSGLLRFTRTEYDRQGEDGSSEMTFELPEIVEGLKVDEGDGEEPELAAAFVQRLQHALTPLWGRYANQLDEPFGLPRTSRKIGPRLRLAQVFYANRAASGRAFLATIDLEHTIHKSPTGRYDSSLEAPVMRRVFHDVVLKPRIFVRGKRSCAHFEPLSGSIDDDVAAMRVIDRIFEGTRHGSRCTALVGGPIDIAVIDGAGRRWLKRKELGQYSNQGNLPCEISESYESVPRT